MRVQELKRGRRKKNSILVIYIVVTQLGLLFKTMAACIPFFLPPLSYKLKFLNYP